MKIIIAFLKRYGHTVDTHTYIYVYIRHLTFDPGYRIMLPCAKALSAIMLFNNNYVRVYVYTLRHFQNTVNVEISAVHLIWQFGD